MSSTDKQYYVLKSINKHMKAVKNKSRLYRFWGNNAIDSLRTEANILKELNHPNVVQLVEVIVDNRMNDFILIEELVPGRIVMEESVSALSFPLTSRSPQTPIPTTKAVQIFGGILKGIYYCHAHNVVHGDLKVSNVMVENSWEELPSDSDALDLLSQPTSPTTQFDSGNGESLWSPQPIGSERREGV